jgi:hypothetical protein
MSDHSTPYYIVHTRDGRIVAAASVEAPSTPGGVHLRWRPVAGPDHVVSEIPLTDEHVGLLVGSAFADLEVDVGAKHPQLRRRSGSATHDDIRRTE